jgi:hypothetical protein
MELARRLSSDSKIEIWVLSEMLIREIDYANGEVVQ